MAEYTLVYVLQEHEWTKANIVIWKKFTKQNVEGKGSYKMENTLC